MNTPRNMKNDEAGVSAVVGTILMVAVTVVLGAIVFAILNNTGDADTSGPDRVIRAQALDGQKVRFGITDGIALPVDSLGNLEITVNDIPCAAVAHAASSVGGDGIPALTHGATAAAWGVGEYIVLEFEDAAGTDCEDGLDAGDSVALVMTFGGKTLVETSLVLLA
jgi:hypothetical protein